MKIAESMIEDPAQKHSGKNGKKEGLSGSSFFTWFMVIALLGVWTSVAVVWFDLVDYEEFLGKLGDYDADGDGDFDVDDAKVLLGLKERSVSKKVSEDHDETESVRSDISEADLEDAVKAIKDAISPDAFDSEDALEDHEAQDVTDFSLEDALEPNVDESVDEEPVSDFSLEDAVEPSVHESLSAEPEIKDEAEEEPVIEDQVIADEEPEVEEQAFEEVTEQVLEQEPHAASDNVEEATFEQEEPEPLHEQEVEETETEFLNAPETEKEESKEEYDAELLSVVAEEILASVTDEEAETEVVTEEQEAQDEENSENDQEPEVAENQEDSEAHADSVLMGEENLSEPSEDEAVSYDEGNEYNPQTELEEEEPAELSDVLEEDGENVPEQTEETAAAETTDEGTVEEDVVADDHEEEVHEAQGDEPETSHEHIEVEQNEIPENPVVDDRPSEKVEEQNTEALEGQQEGHADT